jgi:hypothetical protein
MNSRCNRFYQANINQTFLSVSENNDQNDCTVFLTFLTSFIQTNILYYKSNWINSIICMWYLQSVCSGLLWFSFHLDIWGFPLSITLWNCLEPSQFHIQGIPQAVIIECKYCPLSSTHNWDLGHKKGYVHVLHRNRVFFTFPPFINFCLIYFTTSYKICYQYTVFYAYLHMIDWLMDWLIDWSNVQPYFSVHNICTLNAVMIIDGIRMFQCYWENFI